MSSGFFSNGSSAGVTLTPSTSTGTDTGFFGSDGSNVAITSPFTGVLANSTATIGKVAVTNFPTTFNVGNFPITPSSLRINNDLSSPIPVIVQNPVGVQDVRVTNPTTAQTVSGTVSIGNLPDVQKVTLTGPSSVLATLSASTQHIGSVSVDGPIIGSVSVNNFPGTFAISNFPAPITSVSVSNLPSPQTSIRVNNDTSAPIPVTIVGGSAGGGGTSFDGIIRNTNGQAIPVTITGGQSSFSGSLSAGSAHIGNVGIDGQVTVGGSVAVSSLPAISGTVSVTGTHPVTVSSGSITISNPVTSVSINNLPPTQAVSGSVNASIVGTPTVALASNSVTVSNALKLDTSTPIPVTVTNPSSGGGTFDGNVTVTNAVRIDSTTPVNVHLANGVAMTGNVYIDGGTITGTVTIDHDVKLANSTAHIGTVSIADPVSVVSSVPLSTFMTNPTSGTPYDADGQGSLPVVGPGGGNIQVDVASGVHLVAGTTHIGNVSIDAMPAVSIAGTVPVSLASVPTHGVTIQGTPTVALASNSVSVSNLPAPITSLSISNLPDTQKVSIANTVAVSGTITANVTFPVTQAVSIANTVPVSGTVALASNAVTVSGAVTATISGTPNVTVSNPVTSVTATQSVGVTPTDGSGSITTGGTAQQLVAANPSRKGGWVQNLSSADLYISDVGTAALGGSSLKIPASSLYEFPHFGIPVTAISIAGATSGQAFSARFW